MEVNLPAATAGSAASGSGSFVGSTLIFFLILTGLIFGGFLLYYIVSKLTFKAVVSKGLNSDKNAFLTIKIPSDNQQKAEAFDQFLRSLHRVLPNNTVFSLEMDSSNQFLKFFIVVPEVYRNVLESQLYAQYPTAEVEPTTDYLPEFDENAAMEELDFKHSSHKPLNTYHQLPDDLLKNLSALLSKTNPGEQIFLQIVLKRVGSKFYQRGAKAGFAKLFGKKYNGETPTPSHFKLSQDIYMGKMRLLFISTDKLIAQTKLKTVVNIFKGVKSPFNELREKQFYSLSKTPISAFKARIFENGDIWTASEVATIYHFPYQGSIVSNIVQSTSKRAPAPDILPFLGLVDPKAVSFFGETNYRNENRPFGIKRFDRRRHLYVVGKTGSGKSRFLELLLISDIQSGQGCCLIDPHGDLADELLKYVPKERIEDVIYVNPADRDFPIGFNPLEPVADYEARQHLSRFFIAIFKKLFAGSWTPRMEHLIRYITLALLETPDSNVLGIPRILSDTQFRQRVIKQIQDPVVKSFWTNEFSPSDQQFNSEAIIPIVNKVGQFISNPVIRNMIGQQKNMLDFEKFMNEGKIVIINASKGKLGDENTALLGSMFITKIQQAALARSKMAEEERRDFYFYVDEFQNFATDAFSSILSEARKYRLDLTIAHQYIAQLPEEVKATAFGNVGSIVVFAVGGDDAAYLAKEFAPVFSPDDMINLNTREMYVKMSVDGRLTQPFSARTLTIPSSKEDYSEEIINKSRMKFSKNRVAVENEIARWQNNTESIDQAGESSFPEPLI